MDLRIVESICCVRCGAQCEEEQADDLLVYTCPEDNTRHVLTVRAATDVAVDEGADPLVGRTLGPCRVVRRAGTEGGVPLYHGLQVALNQPQSVLVISGEAARDRARLEGFVRTSRFAAAAHQAAVANVVHLGKFEGGIFAVAAPLEGRPLDEALDATGRLGIRKALHIGRQLAEALAELHDRNIVHRNLGPKSIYLLPNGAPQLRNFAFAIGPGQPPEPLTVVGQPGYMAPEQATGGEIDGRADLYALGAVLYHALAGRPPFAGSDASDTVRNQLANKEPDRHTLTGGAPPVVADLVLSMLAADADERPVDARVVLDALTTAEAQIAAQEALADAQAAEPAAATPAPDAAVPTGGLLDSLALEDSQLSIAEPQLAGPELPEPPPEPAPQPKPQRPAAPQAAPPPASEQFEPEAPAEEPMSSGAALEFGPRPKREQPSEPAPRAPKQAPKPKAKPQEQPSGKLSELVLSADDAGSAADKEEKKGAEADEAQAEAAVPVWKRQPKLVALIGIVAVLALVLAWQYFGGSAPPEPKPSARTTGKAKPKKPKPRKPKPKKPTAAELTEKEAKKELPKLEDFAKGNAGRPERTVERCDEFLKKYGETSCADAAEKIRLAAKVKLLERDAERELGAASTAVSKSGSAFREGRESLEQAREVLAKYADIKTKGVVMGRKKLEQSIKKRIEAAEKKAEEAYTRAKKPVATALEKKNFGAALTALAKVAEPNAGTKAGDEATAQLAKLRQRATRMFDDKKGVAEMAVQKCSFDEAIALFHDPIETWNVPEMKDEAEKIVAKLRERRVEIVATWGTVLAEFDKLAADCKFREAEAAVRKAMDNTEDPVLRELLAGKARDAARMIKALERVVAGAKVQQAATAKSKDGKMWIELGRTRFKGTIDTPTLESVVVHTPMKKGAVSWGELSRGQLIAFALSAKGTPTAADHIAFGLLAFTGADLTKGCEHFAKAIEADETTKETVVGCLRRGATGLVRIPAGEFLAGKNKKKAELTGFLIGAREVSNVEYALFLRLTEGQPPPHWRNGKYLRGHDEYPVCNVTQAEANAYAEWLSMRLPTNTEWEKAARGNDGREYPWGEVFERRRANITPNAVAKDKKSTRRPRLTRWDRTTIKGLPYPLYHIVGNVREWTNTPAGGKDSADYVVVGGSAADTEKDAMVTARKEQTATQRDLFTGFRLVWPR